MGRDSPGVGLYVDNGNWTLRLLDNALTNASVASELPNVLINNLRPYYSMFVRLQRKTNIMLHIWFYSGSPVGKMSNL